jgi:ketosteroid isomerase-like protein
MAEQENVQIVQEAYAAFKRGEVPAVLNAFADNIDWFTPGPPELIPYAGRRRGREQVAQFFAALDQAEAVERFEPQEFIAKGDKVIALGKYGGRIKSSGKRYETDWAHVFALRQGKIVSFREYTDTAAAVELYRATSAQSARKAQ